MTDPGAVALFAAAGVFIHVVLVSTIVQGYFDFVVPLLAVLGLGTRVRPRRTVIIEGAIVLIPFAVLQFVMLLILADMEQPLLSKLFAGAELIIVVAWSAYLYRLARWSP